MAGRWSTFFPVSPAVSPLLDAVVTEPGFVTTRARSRDRTAPKQQTVTVFLTSMSQFLRAQENRMCLHTARHIRINSEFSRTAQW